MISKKKDHKVHVSSLWYTQAPKLSTRHTNYFFQPFKLASCGLVVFIDMKTYVTEGGRNFKTFLKENYAIALDRSLRNGVLFMLAWVAWVACLRE